MPKFELWLEFELWRATGDTDDPADDFFMQVKLDDGRKYALKWHRNGGAVKTFRWASQA